MYFTIVAMVLLPAAVYANPPEPVSPVGLVSKVVLDVSHREAQGEWQKAKRGDPLASGDKVLTGEKSLAIIKFKDNSMVRVREKTEVTITGTVEGTAFSKSVRVEQGVVGFNIQKQRSQEEFRFTSPTSVASIRGTGGQFVTASSADTLVVIEGEVWLTNVISSDSVEVSAGFTGISASDGSVQVRPSTPAESAAASNASRTGDQENRLEFEMRDSRGNRKELRIEYKE